MSKYSRKYCNNSFFQPQMPWYTETVTKFLSRKGITTLLTWQYTRPKTLYLVPLSGRCSGSFDHVYSTPTTTHNWSLTPCKDREKGVCEIVIRIRMVSGMWFWHILTFPTSWQEWFWSIVSQRQGAGCEYARPTWGRCGEVLRLTPMPRTIPSTEFVRLLKVDARRHEKRSGVWQRVPLRARYWQCTRSTMELRFWRMWVRCKILKLRTLMTIQLQWKMY